MIRPRVSVIIPVYNTGKYLGESLKSLKNQTLKDIEVIAIDDGSTDNSAEILQEWSSKLDMIILTKKNAGQAAARNDGLDIAAGDYIYFLDSDDWIDPETLEACVAECDKKIWISYFSTPCPSPVTDRFWKARTNGSITIEAHYILTHSRGR